MSITFIIVCKLEKLWICERKYITFNDGAMIGIMRLLYSIISADSLYGIISKELSTRIDYAFEKGLECILNSQIIENNKLLVMIIL